MSYVTPKRDVTYTRLSIITANQIYEVVEEKEDGVTVMDNKGQIYFLHGSNINCYYEKYSQAVIHKNYPLWITAVLLIAFAVLTTWVQI